MKEVGKMLGIEVVCFDYNSEFFRMEHRAGELTKLAKELLGACGDVPVFTHNPWGEYGHLDHILLHQIARNLPKVYCSDIYHPEVAWFPARGYYAGDDYTLDTEILQRCKAIYDRYGCWTWSFPVKQTCKVFRCL